MQKTRYFLVRFLFSSYRLVARTLWGPCCRFYPSCSEYAETAIFHHGIFRALPLIFKRLLKCHPWHIGGVDFVPALHSKRMAFRLGLPARRTTGVYINVHEDCESAQATTPKSHSRRVHAKK